MTVRGLGAAMLRRWYVVFVVLILAAVGGYSLERGKGVYTTETVVSFINPGQTTLSRYSGLDDANLIAFAGLVVRALDNGKTPAVYSEDGAPFYGAGVRQGVAVSLPNYGNQWVTSYQRAEIVLRIVGPSEQWVARTQDDLLKKIVQISENQQASVTSEKSLIHAVPVELTKTIYHVLPSRTATISAFLALLFGALIVGGWAAVEVDRVARRRKIGAWGQALPHAASEGQRQ